MTLMKTFLFLVFSSKLTFCEKALYTCKSKETCNECIQELGCVWCINPKSDFHCLSKDEISQEWCDTDKLEGTAGSGFEILENRPFSSDLGNSIQIRPQRVKLRLKKNEEYKLSFQYLQATNYPVDLYYIMDLSRSMKIHKNNLAKLGIQLAETMRNITEDFRIGFGSFVDKTDLPFVSTAPEKLIRPCKDGCVPAYSFKNHFSLSTDYRKFSEKVSQAEVSGNQDPPEGGLDALMQAIVCKNVVGWRDRARRLIVLLTDNHFHIAGDGRLAGVVEPNDALCHMENNLYTASLKLDYPSVSQINSVAKDNNINLILAIAGKEDVRNTYAKLSEVLENSNWGILNQDFKNVINLVVENYKKILNSVTISSTSSKNVEVKISSTCPHQKTNGCTKIHLGEIVDFEATIKPLKCPRKSKRKTISIKPETLDETITVDLEVMCTCSCDSPSSQYYTPESDKCSNKGTLKCGVCDCDSGFFGKGCQCSKEISQSDDVTDCKPNLNDTTVCSGLGTCQCGQCQCHKRNNPDEKIFGKYCDCDNYSCKRVDGKLCSKRGTCDCGVCNCQAGWTGEACQCPDTNSSCIQPDGKNLICNGHGRCNCGKCECYDEEVRYSGKYCSECPTCEGQRCEELRHCVECRVYNEAKCQNCTFVTIEIVQEVDEEKTNLTTCVLLDDDECSFTFQYQELDETYVKILAKKEKACPGPPNVLAWVLGVIGSVLLAGLVLLLLWKIWTMVHDRIEYVRFENESKHLKWHTNQNPLYREATSNFVNPLWRRRPVTQKADLAKKTDVN